MLPVLAIPPRVYEVELSLKRVAEAIDDSPFVNDSGRKYERFRDRGHRENSFTRILTLALPQIDDTGSNSAEGACNDVLAEIHKKLVTTAPPRLVRVFAFEHLELPGAFRLGMLLCESSHGHRGETRTSGVKISDVPTYGI